MKKMKQKDTQHTQQRENEERQTNTGRVRLPSREIIKLRRDITRSGFA
jgi:hypothetical protein